MEISEGLKRKSLKLADDEQLDKALYGWFIFRSASLNESETFLYTEMADRKFKASTGWLEKFKTWHGIRNLSIQGNKLSAAEETVEPFLQKLHKVKRKRT